MLPQLVNTPEQSKTLIDEGIKSPAAFWWVLSPDETPDAPKVWKVKQLKNPVPGPEVLPAWTMEELTFFIGEDFDAPGFVGPDTRGRHGDPLEFAVYTITTMKLFKSGAQAAAAFLIILIQAQQIAPRKADERYKKRFL